MPPTKIPRSPGALLLALALLNTYQLLGQVYFNLRLDKAMSGVATMSIWAAVVILVLWSSKRIHPAALLVVPYVMLQCVRGLLVGERPTDALAAAAIYIGVFAVAGYLATLDLRKYMRLFADVLVWSVVLIFVANLGNWVARGHGIAGMIQKEIPMVAAAMVFVLLLSPRDLDLRWMRRALAFLALWYPVESLLGYLGGTLQEIGVALFLSVLLFLALLWVARRVLHRRRSDVIVARSALRMSLLVAAMVAPNLLIIGLTLSSTSLIERIGVATVMIEEVAGSVETMSLGFGFGSSERRFDVVSAFADLGGRFEAASGAAPDAEILPHSGLIMLIYENGLLGMLVLAYALRLVGRTCVSRFGALPLRDSSRFLAYTKLASLFFAFLVFAGNVMTFSGVPSADPYYQANIVGNLMAMLIAVAVLSGRPKPAARAATVPADRHVSIAPATQSSA